MTLPAIIAHPHHHQRELSNPCTCVVHYLIAELKATATRKRAHAKEFESAGQGHYLTLVEAAHFVFIYNNPCIDSFLVKVI